MGNIGSVYRGGDDHKAEAAFVEYSEQSAIDYGRAAGEDVTWLKNGEIHKEFEGSISKKELEKEFN